MKAISLWEPWASLIAIGAKKFETRSWATSYRGPLLICAAKKEVPWDVIEGVLEGKNEVRDRLVASILDIHQEPGSNLPPYRLCRALTAKDFPLGKAVALADLVAIYRTEDIGKRLTGRELSFGDFSPGRFAWKLENVRPFKEPFPVKGKQGLFEVDDNAVMIRVLKEATF